MKGGAYDPQVVKRVTKSAYIATLSAKSAYNSLDTVRILGFSEAHISKAINDNPVFNRVSNQKEPKNEVTS